MEAPSEFYDLDYEANTDSCSEECRQDLIRKRAYEIFKERGRRSGHEVEDWLSAERELNHHIEDQARF